MLIKIIYSLTIILSDHMDHPIIINDSTIVHYKSSNENICHNCTQSSQGFESIDTLFIFKDPTELPNYKINEDEMSKKLNIFFLDIIEGEFNKMYISKHCDNTNREPGVECSLLIKLKKHKKNNQFKISLQPKDNTTNNPLIEYLKKNPSKAFRLKFSFHKMLNRASNNDLLRLIEVLEEQINSFRELIENEIKETAIKVNTACESYSDFDKRLNKETKHNIYVEIIEKIKLIEMNYCIPAELKSKTISYLKEAIKFLYTTVIEQTPATLIEDQFLEKHGAFLEIYNATKIFLKEQIKLKMTFLNIPTSHKRQMLLVYGQEINTKACVDFCFISCLIKRLRHITPIESKLLTFYTRAFRLNTKTETLEAVEEQPIIRYESEVKTERILKLDRTSRMRTRGC
ncbi:hypothetical protein CDIK_3276 [Cucumispora dikerogammari]|nr:hypothetical protein CDIK_3276 [Cucumispora dikerogammari]